MLKLLLAAFVLSASMVLPVSSTAQNSTAMQPLSAEERSSLSPSRAQLELGRDVAQTACASCHGLDGVSPMPGIPHIAGQRTVYLHRVLKSYQQQSRTSGDMNHAVGFLNDDAILAVSAYYASLAPARPQSGDVSGTKSGGGDPFAGIRDDMKKCDKCHGEDGNASASGMPNLTAQDPAYFVESMQAYREGERDHRMMTRLVSKLDDETLLKMGIFYAVQEPARTETLGEGNVDLGREASESCAGCHGPDGNPAGGNMPTLAGQDARYFIKAMQAYRDGKRSHQNMFDAVESLSETDIENMASFYAAQEPVRRNVRTPLTTAEWIVRCERCHGINGNSTDPRFPMLAGQERNYLTSALRSYSGAGRGNTAMHAMSAPLSETDIETIVEYYSTSEPKSVVYMQLPCEDAAAD